MKNSIGKFGAVFASLLVLGGSFYFGYSYGVSHIPEKSLVSGLNNIELSEPDNVDFEPFWKAWNIINDMYVSLKLATTSDTITNEKKVWGAIQGLTDSLGDPYTVFFPPEESKMFQNEISGSFEGIGVEIGVKESILTVVAPLKGTPAERAGLMSGDKILMINNLPTNDIDIDTAIRNIRGKQGTEVRLLISRVTKKEPFEVKITRGIIDIPTISSEIKISDGAGGTEAPSKVGDVFVIKLYSFNAQSATLFRNSLRDFVISGGDKLIIDLRGNPGGYLEASVDMASWFLPPGKIVVKEESAKGKTDRIYRSSGYNIFSENLKMVILVNGGSASASEILAGALKEHNIAKLVGVKTFGKGSVQELVPITTDTSLKITIARWVTPSGHSISEEGLKPDFEIDLTEQDLIAGRDPQMEKAIEVLQSWK